MGGAAKPPPIGIKSDVHPFQTCPFFLSLFLYIRQKGDRDNIKESALILIFIVVICAAVEEHKKGILSIIIGYSNYKL